MGQENKDKIYKNQQGLLNYLIISRIIFNVIWVVNSCIIMYLISIQRGHNGQPVNCFAVSGIPKPYMLNSTWELTKNNNEVRKNGHHEFSYASYTETLDEITSGDTTVWNFSMW